jgi:hypothetical protein
MGFKSTDKVLTPEFRASYVKLDGKSKNRSGKPLYGLTMIFEPDVVNTPEFKAMKDICAEAKKLAWGDKPPSWTKSPFREGKQKTDEYQNGFDLSKNPEYEGMIIVTANSVDIRPDIRDAKVQPIMDTNEVYSGCYCRAFVVAYGYEPTVNPETGQKEGSYGITFGLQAVQKIRDGERLAGGVTDAGKDFAPFSVPATVGANEDMMDLDV